LIVLLLFIETTGDNMKTKLQSYLLIFIHDDVSFAKLGFWLYRHFDSIFNEGQVGISDSLQVAIGRGDAIEDSYLVSGYETSLLSQFLHSVDHFPSHALLNHRLVCLQVQQHNNLKIQCMSTKSYKLLYIELSYLAGRMSFVLLISI
jgi:hypothetical protein